MSFNAVSLPIVRASSAIDDLRLFIDLCLTAISQASHAANVTQLAALISNKLPEISSYATPEDLERAASRATQIKEFTSLRMKPFLFELASVRFWSILEACVDELVVECLKSLDRCSNQVVLGSIKGPLLEFTQASDEERADYLAESLKAKTDARLKLGAGRFESILEPCGLGGGVHELTRRALLELSQVRNIVIHRAGIVDGRALSQCPWIRFKSGESLRLTMDDYCLYGTGIHQYLMELKRRIYRRENIPLPESFSQAVDPLVVLLEKQFGERSSKID